MMLRCLPLSLLLLLTTISPVMAREDQTDAMPLKLKVMPSFREIHSGAGLMVIFEVTNISATPVTACWPTGNSQCFRLDIINTTTGLPVPYLQNAGRQDHGAAELSAAGEPTAFSALQPGEVRTWQIPVTGSAEPWLSRHTVFLRQPGEYRLTPSLHLPYSRAMHAKTGEVTLRPDAWTGVLKASAFDLTVLPAPPIQKRRQLIQGQVQDEQGQPVSHAIVQLQKIVPNHAGVSIPADPLQSLFWEHNNSQTVDQAVTDQAGHFSFAEIPASDRCRVKVLHDHHGDGWQVVPSVRWCQSDVVSLNVKLSPQTRRRYTGRVVDAHGKPVSDVLVAHRSWTDLQGKFEFDAKAEDSCFSADLWRTGFVSRSIRLVPDQHTDYVLFRPEPQTVTSRLMFTDGSPAANCKLEFQLKQDTQSYQGTLWRSTSTDSRGEFAVTFPDRAQWSGTLNIVQDDNSHQQRRWRTEVRSLGVTTMPDQISVENRGRLLVSLPGSEVYQDDADRLKLYCYGDDGCGNVPIHLPAGKTGLLIQGLSPGTYRLTARVDHLDTTITATVSGESSWQSRVTLQVPDVRAGTIRARIMSSDGRTAAAGQRIHWRAAQSGGSAITSADGHLEITDVPPGKCRLTIDGPRFPPTDAPQPPNMLGFVSLTSGILPAGGVLDLGTLTLPELAVGMHWVKGSVCWDDRTPVDGISVTRESHGAHEVPAITLLPWDFDSPVSHDGTFHVPLMTGRQLLRISCPDPGYAKFPMSGSPYLLFPVNVAAQLPPQHLVLSRRPEPVCCRLRCLAPHVPWYTMTLAAADSEFVWLNHHSLSSAAPASVTDVPAGDGCALLTGGQGEHSFAGRFPLDEMQANELTEINPSCWGTITLQLPPLDSIVSEDPRLQVTTPLGPLQYPIAHRFKTNDWSVWHIHRNREHFQRTDDGTWQIRGLGPGPWRITLLDEQQRELAAATIDRPAAGDQTVELIPVDE